MTDCYPGTTQRAVINPTGQSFTPSPASYHWGTNSPCPQWIKGEALQPEHRGKESSALKGRRMPTNCGVASYDATQVPQTGTRDYTAPWLQGGGSLLTKGSLAHSCCQSTPRTYATGNTGGTFDSYYVHNCILQDVTMGITYMDMVTISMGRVALSSSCMVQCSS